MPPYDGLRSVIQKSLSNWFNAGRGRLRLSTASVRSGSVKRVASAVGEGTVAVQFVHECLKHV
jgi:hypothetical protein